MNPEDQLVATREVRDALIGVEKRLASNEYLIDKNRRLTRAVFVMGLVMAVVLLVVVFVVRDNRDLAERTVALGEENQRNAVQSCLNANESRKAILDGWHFILGWELVDEQNNPAETEMADLILPWFDQVYVQRDCSDLSKKYDIPPVPKIPIGNRPKG